MKQVVFGLALVGIAACARLDYLPPAPPAGSGSGAFAGISAPGAGGGAGGGDGSFRTSGSFGGGSSGGKQIPILRFDDNNDGEGSYSYNYETGNGIQAQEKGDARGDGTKAQGGFSYTSPDGQQVHISYTADENGFVAQGSHIPTPPPIPEEIQRALQQNLADEARGIVDDGQYREDSSGQYRADSSGQYRGGAGAGAGAGFGAGAGAGAGFGAGAGAGAGSRQSGGTSYSQNGGYRY